MASDTKEFRSQFADWKDRTCPLPVGPCHPVGLGRSQEDPVTDAKSWGNNRENRVVWEETAPR
jgi:hypothetical protein